MNSPDPHPPLATLSQEFTQRLISCQPVLYSRIATLMGTVEGAHDVLQNTNVALCKRANDYDDSRPFLAWAFVFARFEVMAWRKTQQRSHLVLDDELVNQFADELVEGDDSCGQRLAALEQCLERLPARQRELLAERYEFNRSVQRIAARLDMSDNSVAALLYRIRRSLQTCIQLRLNRGEA